jgi:hypothetical protein
VAARKAGMREHTLVLSVLSAACVLCLVGGAPSVTLGVAIPVHQGANGDIFLPFQKIGASILLAIHHVNTRDASVVGQDTLKKLPEGFQVRFRLADTYFDSGPAVRALLSWMYDLADKGSCQTGWQGQVATGAGAASSNESSSPIRAPLHLYEAAPDSKDIDAVLGAFSSEVTQTSSVIASLKSLPSISFASTSTALGNKERYPHFLR